MSTRGSAEGFSGHSHIVRCSGQTHGIGDFAHGIVAHVEVAEAPALDQAGRERREEVVGEGESTQLVFLNVVMVEVKCMCTSQSRP
jgi:hypothetical protein